MNTKRLFVYFLFVAVLFSIGVYLLKTNTAKINLPALKLLSVTPTSSTNIVPTVSISLRPSETAIVKRVIDGDTIELESGLRVRYIGIDTPELPTSTKGIECFAKEATEKNKELVEGKTIVMKKDVSETDKYQRLLRYVWIGGIFVNEYLVQEGYARQATFPPDVAYSGLFRSATMEAKKSDKGLWNACK